MKKASLLAWLLCTGLSTTSYAQDSDPASNAAQASQLYNTGQEQFEARDFLASAQTFTRALELDPNAILAYNAARSFENGGDIDNARLYYTRALELAPPDTLKRKIEDALLRLDTLEKRLRGPAATTGMLVVETDKPAQLSLNGQPQGLTPVSLELAPGEYLLEISLEGHQPWTRSVSVEKGQSLNLSAPLIPDQDQPLSAQALSGWVLVGTGAVFTGAGLVFGALTWTSNQDIQALANQSATSPIDGARADQLIAQANTRQNLQFVSYGLGGACLLTGALLLLLEDSPEAPLQTGGLRLTPLLSPQASGLRLQWRH